MITFNQFPADTSSFTRSAGIINTLTGWTADDLLFFDIETTGLSPESSYLYLIGCMFKDKDDNVTLVRFFSERLSDEPVLIESFLDLLKEHPVLVHYNGSTFDVPYVRHKAGYHNIPFPDDITEIDIYKRIRPLKGLLRSTSMKQKSVERLLGLTRKDPYDGGELIDLYLKYIARTKFDSLKKADPSETAYSINERVIPADKPSVPDASRKITETFSPESSLRLLGDCGASGLLDAILLHNYEDVYNLAGISVLLAPVSFLEGCFSSVSCYVSEDSGSITLSVRPLFPETAAFFENTEGTGILPLPVSEKLTTSGGIPFFIRTGINGDSIEISIPLIKDEKKLFLADHKNYYYLPAEDYCVHKSLGSLLDRSVAVKCTRLNCYTKKTGAFAPVTAKKGGDLKDLIHLYQDSFKDSNRYVLAEDLIKNPEALKKYAMQILTELN